MCMMYLSHTNDGPKSSEKLLLAAVLDINVINDLRAITSECERINFPYPTHYRFVFPTDKVRLLEDGFLDEYLTDCKKYEQWALSGDDPLDYYRFQLHPYEPKEDYWNALQPDSVTLVYSHPNSFGLDATRRGITYFGYEFDWSKLLEYNT